MSKEKKIVPELRFPEFKGDGEWVEKKLGDIGDPLMCKRIFKDQTTTNPENAIPFYKIGTFGREADAYISVDLYNEFKNKYSFPNKGDILISASGTIGRLVVYDGAPAYFQDSNIVWLGHDEKSVLNSFLFYCYSTINWQTSDGGVIKRLYNSDLKNIQIRFPERKAEQQKIAACLSSLDHLIAAHRDKLQALNDHKKGLMQNPFPQEGEKAPKYRFPEFRDNWQIKKLSKCIQLISGLHLSPDDYGITGETPYFTGPSDFTNKESDIKKWTKKSSNTAEANDTLITVKGSGVGELWYLTVPCVAIGRQLMAVRANGCSSPFLYHFLGTKRSRFEDLASGNLIPGLSRNDILDLEMPIPSLAEQQKIAACLSALDLLITAKAEKIEQLQQHKKGLMQGLFPKV